MPGDALLAEFSFFHGQRFRDYFSEEISLRQQGFGRQKNRHHAWDHFEKRSREKPHNHRKSSHTIRASSQHFFLILKTYAALLRWRDVCSPRWTNLFSNGQLASTIGFIARQDCVAKDLMGKKEGDYEPIGILE
jgi:hypothetical protein